MHISEITVNADFVTLALTQVHCIVHWSHQLGFSIIGAFDPILRYRSFFVSSYSNHVYIGISIDIFGTHHHGVCYRYRTFLFRFIGGISGYLLLLMYH